MKQRGIALALIALAGAIIAVVAVVSGGDEPEFQTIANSEDADYEYIIPLGAGAKIEAGESINIIPAELMVRVGESLRIINDDDRGHVVGVFFVGAGVAVKIAPAIVAHQTRCCRSFLNVIREPGV